MKIKFITVQEITLDVEENDWRHALRNDSVEEDFDCYRSDMNTVEDYAVNEAGERVWMARGC